MAHLAYFGGNKTPNFTLFFGEKGVLAAGGNHGFSGDLRQFGEGTCAPQYVSGMGMIHEHKGILKMEKPNF